MSKNNNQRSTAVTMNRPLYSSPLLTSLAMRQGPTETTTTATTTTKATTLFPLVGVGTTTMASSGGTTLRRPTKTTMIDEDGQDGHNADDETRKRTLWHNHWRRRMGRSANRSSLFAMYLSRCAIFAVFLCFVIQSFSLVGFHERTLRPVKATARSLWELLPTVPKRRRSTRSDSHSHSSEEERNKNMNIELVLFNDVTVGEFHSKGSINIACYANVPEWWRTQHGVPAGQKYIMKLTGDLDYAGKEIEAWEKLNADADEARRLEILPLVAATRNIENPYYCSGSLAEKEGNSRNASRGRHREYCQSLPESFPLRTRKYLQKERRLAAFVVPYAKSRHGYVFDGIKNLQQVKYFMRSMLGQLAHAHNVGVNYLDLSGNRNVFVGEDGGAILFDWNGALGIGEKSYNRKNNFSILPPEAWMEDDGRGHEFQMVSLSAWDVWSAGVIFARLVFYPCRWATHYRYRSNTEKRIRGTILALGGNTVIPVDKEGNTLDLAEYVGLDVGTVRNVQYQPHLVNRHETLQCPTRQSFQYLEEDGVSNAEKELALDLLRSMMKINPLERPDCETLLQHPFFSS